MFSEESIALAAQRIAAASSSPAKVILIGSYARGDATEDSDVDLVVLQKEFADKPSEFRRLNKEVRKELRRVDLILMREEDFEWRSLVGGTLPYWAKKEGRVLHEPC
jgi:uncharacterized protein